MLFRSEFGVPLLAEPNPRPPAGDLGRLYRFTPGVATSEFFHYFHTDRETPETVPWTGLQATTRAYAKIVDEVNTLPLSALQRQPDAPYKPRVDLTGCEAWIKDSSAPCKPRTQ